MKDMVLSVARHIATAVAGVLVTLGYLDEQSSSEALGYVIGLVGVVWGVWDKRGRVA